MGTEYTEEEIAEISSDSQDRNTRLAICSHCILSICNIYLFPALVLRAGFAF